MSGRWLVFVESNTSGTGRLFAQVAQRHGLRPMVLAVAPERYRYVAEDELASRRVDTQDVQALLGVCHELAAGAGVAGVWSSSEYFIAMAAQVSAALGLVGPCAAAIVACRDKYEQCVRLYAAGVRVPAFQVADSVAGAVAAAEQLGYPVVVKPVDGSGSVGVRCCVDAAEVRMHVAHLLGQRFNERGLPVTGRVLVEMLVQGPEYSVETFGMQVVGVTAKYLGAAPFFIEVGHDFPARLSDAAYAAITDVALRALTALGLGWGPAHIEVRLDASGPVIIEVNPRLAGGFIPELVRIAQGVDLIDATVRLVVGEQVVLERSAAGFAAIRFLLPTSEQFGLRGQGVLLRVDGLDAVGEVPGVVGVAMYQAVGSEVRRSGDFRERLGHVIARGETGAQAAAVADQALALLCPHMLWV